MKIVGLLCCAAVDGRNWSNVKLPQVELNIAHTGQWFEKQALSEGDFVLNPPESKKAFGDGRAAKGINKCAVGIY